MLRRRPDSNPFSRERQTRKAHFAIDSGTMTSVEFRNVYTVEAFEKDAVFFVARKNGCPKQNGQNQSEKRLSGAFVFINVSQGPYLYGYCELQLVFMGFGAFFVRVLASVFVRFGGLIYCIQSRECLTTCAGHCQYSLRLVCSTTIPER